MQITLTERSIQQEDLAVLYVYEPNNKICESKICEAAKYVK